MDSTKQPILNIGGRRISRLTAYYVTSLDTLHRKPGGNGMEIWLGQFQSQQTQDITQQ
jgi:hypothetical protein